MFSAQLVTTYSFVAEDRDACAGQGPRGNFVLVAKKRIVQGGRIFSRQQAGRSSVFGLYTQRRHDCHGGGEDLVVTGSADYLITTPVEERQIGSPTFTRAKGGRRLSRVG